MGRPFFFTQKDQAKPISRRRRLILALESKQPTSDSLTGEARTFISFEKTKLSKGELLLRESWVESIALRSHRIGPNC